MVDLTPFKEGINKAMNEVRMVSSDPKGDFLSFISSLGFKVQGHVIEGRIVRVDAPDDKKKGKQSGWYIYREINDTSNPDYVIGIASYGSWKEGVTHHWSSRSDSAMSREERLNFFAEREKMRVAYEEEKRRLNEETAKSAYELWSTAPDASPDNDYFKRKQVKPCQGIKEKDGVLLVPMADESLQVVNVEKIYPDGTKKGLYGGVRKGAWFKVEGDEAQVYVAEGVSTALSVHEATGNAVYVSFNAGNLYEIVGLATKWHDNVVIAADNDFGNDRNEGLIKAEQASEAYNVPYIYPQGVVDFNDMHVEHGLDALTAYLKPKKADKKADKKELEKYIAPQGVLRDVAAYYTATSGNYQPDFAVQTALALASVVLGRCYKTNYENYSSLFLLNVGKSSTGKEHPKTVIEKILLEAGMANIIAGEGYTSAGAVYSELLHNPKHICIIDEFGRYLEAGRDMGRGNNHQREANTKLMESIGRAHGVLRPPSYSTMTLKKEAAEEMRNRYIYNPAITLLTMTTPDTLFKTLDMGAIKDGFINRFILCISDAKREVRKHKPPLEVPEKILKWIRDVVERHGEAHIASEKSKPIELTFSTAALDMQEDFQSYCIEQANALERFGMAELTGRSNEMAMRIALIHALSVDANAITVEADDMAFGISYVRYCYEKTVGKLKMTISSSDFEGHKKEILADLREKGDTGVTWADMNKQAPYSKHKAKDLREIMAALKDANLAYDEPVNDESTGKPTTLWRALQ